MDTITSFKDSYLLLQRFYTSWLPYLEKQSQGDTQKLAAYYVWARYSMSIRTLAAILDPHLIPDISVICRGCIEFDVSLEAILNDEAVARTYMDYQKHAKARYLKLLSKQGEIDNFLEFSEKFRDAYGADAEQFSWASWCAKHNGITGLMRKLDRSLDERLYSFLSHFTHGSIFALEVLDQLKTDPTSLLATILDSVYTSYLGSSINYVSFLQGTLVVPDHVRCFNALSEVAGAFVIPRP